MRYDIVERAQRAHLVDGFCEIINCPECAIRRQQRLAPGKELRSLKHELEATVAAQADRIAHLETQLAQCQDSREFWMEQAFAGLK